MGKFGWAYIGCGSIANTTAKQICKSENNRIVAIWNRGYEKAEAFAKKYGGKAYRTVEEAINAPEVEGEDEGGQSRDSPEWRHVRGVQLY